MKLVGEHIDLICALMIRDLMVRFGRRHLGFIWTVLEPMILTVGVMLVWSTIKEPVVHGVPVVTFVLTGYMPLTLWRHLSTPMARLLHNNAPMLIHRPLRPFHLIFARAMLEFLSTTIALIIIYFTVTSIGVVKPIVDPGLTLAAWLFTLWFFGAQGIMIAAISEYWEPLEKFIPAFQYLSLPVSGVFFMLDWMPSWAQQLLLLNPSVHCFEMFRAGFLGKGITTTFDPWYIAAWSAALTVVGLAALYHVDDRIEYA